MNEIYGQEEKMYFRKKGSGLHQ